VPQRKRNLNFGLVRAQAAWNLKIINGRKTPKTPEGGQ